MRWIARIRVNIGASPEPIISPDGVGLFFAAALHALQRTEGVHRARLVSDEVAGRTSDFPMIEVLFESSGRGDAESAGHDLLNAALDAGFAALPEDAPADLGWSAYTGVEPADPDRA